MEFLDRDVIRIELKKQKLKVPCPNHPDRQHYRDMNEWLCGNVFVPWVATCFGMIASKRFSKSALRGLPDRDKRKGRCFNSEKE